MDGRRLTLQAESSELTFPPGAGGLPTLRIGAVYRGTPSPAQSAAARVLTYRDGNYPGRAGWKEIVARAAPGMRLVESTVPDRDRSRELTDYPTDPAESSPEHPRGAGRLREPGRPGSGSGAGGTLSADAARDPRVARCRDAHGRRRPATQRQLRQCPSRRARRAGARELRPRRTGRRRGPRAAAAGRAEGGRREHRATRSPP